MHINQSHLTICDILGRTTVHISESRKYEINRIFNIVFLGVLIVSTVLLNAVAVITIWKRAKLKNKHCYFVIFVQSSVDLGIGCTAMSIVFFFLYTCPVYQRGYLPCCYFSQVDSIFTNKYVNSNIISVDNRKIYRSDSPILL